MIDLNGVDTMSEFELLPAGKYAGRIVEVEEKTSSRTGGIFYSVKVLLIDHNRYVWDIIVDPNDNKTSQKGKEFALVKMKQILLAIESERMSFDSMQSFFGEVAHKDITVSIGIKDDRNVVKYYNVLKKEEETSDIPF